jgi:hypothetical protein
MAKKKGKIPTLISGSSGAVNYVQALRKRPCKRCDGEIVAQHFCAEVSVPASGFSKVKTFCLSCFSEILNKTEKDLIELRTKHTQLNVISQAK